LNTVLHIPEPRRKPKTNRKSVLKARTWIEGVERGGKISGVSSIWYSYILEPLGHGAEAAK